MSKMKYILSLALFVAGCQAPGPLPPPIASKTTQPIIPTDVQAELRQAIEKEFHRSDITCMEAPWFEGYSTADIQIFFALTAIRPNLLRRDSQRVIYMVNEDKEKHANLRNDIWIEYPNFFMYKKLTHHFLYIDDSGYYPRQVLVYFEIEDGEYKDIVQFVDQAGIRLNRGNDSVTVTSKDIFSISRGARGRRYRLNTKTAEISIDLDAKTTDVHYR